ncbi:MAG TPA: ABC transporter ATP-binding protein, partial [Acidimicrobiales bacterium]|nr:ABC transporter ATP-binding protein [Acidimicrobiales bacterium]
MSVVPPTAVPSVPQRLSPLPPAPAALARRIPVRLGRGRRRRSSHDAERASGIEVVGVDKRFGPVGALLQVDLAVAPGTITALMGRNGAGKSTLLRVLATSVLPDAGRAFVGGCDVARDPLRARRRLGLVLGDDRSYFWRLSGRQNLEFFARLHGVRRRSLADRVAEALDAVELSDVAARRVDRYSTGMRARLGLARALLGEPS